MPPPKYESISTAEHLERFCDEVASASAIAFDTEFVSEDSYRPQLCLIQVAAAGRLAVIDPLEVGSVDAFWRLLAAPGHQTIVHAGREEFRFCHNAINARPDGWFDTQFAAGLIGMEYPAAYNTLVSRVLNINVPKGETRTDWRRRPLSQRQIEYALTDVLHLEPIADYLSKRIDQLDRRDWLDEELDRWQDNLIDYDRSERWSRVSGTSGLSRRSLAIVRELWRWRESEAERRDRPPKRVLRDDLIVELARRKTSDMKRIRAVRGLEHSNVKRHLPELSKCVGRALALPDSECPRPSQRPRSNSQQFTLLGQFVNTVLGCVCRNAELAPTLVGTIQDVRDLVAYHLDSPAKGTSPPALATGWRAEIVGPAIADVLAAKLAVRIRDPLDDQPLELVEVPVD